MAEFSMPSLGADMDAGTLVEWRVGPGDTVAKGDVVAVVETAKSTIEVECFDSGTVSSLLVAPGTTVPVGTPMAVIGPAAEPSAHTAMQQPAVPSPGSHPASVCEVTPGDEAASTPLVRHLARQKDIDLSTVHGSGKGGQITRADAERAASRLPPDPGIAAGPSAGAVLDVDLGTVRGTGRNGTVRADDVRAAAEDRAPRTRSRRPPVAGPPPAPPVRPSVGSGPAPRVREPHVRRSPR
ncbi:biotin/lipoyl-containing protein [Streptomyces sp. NPDC005151]